MEIKSKSLSQPIALPQDSNQESKRAMALHKGPQALKGKQVMTDQRLHDVSKMYEEQFLQSMVRQMRATVSEDELVPTSQAEKFYRQELDDKYAESWAANGGVGFGDLIYQQLKEKFYPDKHIMQKPQGPIAMKSSDRVRAQTASSTSVEQPLSLRFSRAPGAPDAVLAPWPGILLQQNELAPGLQSVLIEHDNGLQSRMVFSGVGGLLKDQQRVDAGQKVALLDPQAQEFFWQIQNSAEPLNSL